MLDFAYKVVNNKTMAFSFRVGTNWYHDFPKLARESGFYFNMHRSRVCVDWNRISNIDIDRVIRDRDFSAVDENVNNVIDYCLESEYDVKILDPNFVKLFRLAQLAVEYLLYCKQYLDHSTVILKDELKSKIEENIKLKKELSSSEDIIKNLKEKSKEKGKLIQARIGNCDGQIHKCPHCPKTFVSAMFVTAHVARRHAYTSDIYSSISPTHDDYRIETEKLHNEIKSLKERLNQTERVIRNESDKVYDNLGGSYERKLYENESLRYNINMSEKQQGHKEYQEEIKSLKNMLFDEIRNLRQRERTIYSHEPETSMQMLMNQQEKEFHKLQSQLLEKLTPDIAGMQVKLHSQENLWKSKIEHLEEQHQKDIQNLTDQLKLTQKASNELKTKYESKVSELERQTIKQSTILLEQNKQIHSLTREINNSQNVTTKSLENRIADKFNEVLNAHQYNNNDKEVMSSLHKKKRVPVEAGEITVEDVNSVSSLDSPRKIESVIPQNGSLHYDAFINIKTSTPKDEESTKQRTRVNVKNASTKFYNKNRIDKNFKNFDSSDIPESEDSLTNEQIKYSTKGTRDNLHPPLSLKNSYLDKSVVRAKKTGLKEAVTQVISKKASVEERPKEIKNDDLSETKTDTVTSESETESESESGATIKSNTPVHENKRLIIYPAKSKKELQSEIQEAFAKKLRDLGIDPEWQGIPKATFKQKMDIVKHHQNITSKKLSKYKQIKSKIIDDMLGRILRRNKETEHMKSQQKAQLSKLVTNVKSSAKKTLSGQKNLDNHMPALKSQDTALSKNHIKQKIKHLPENTRTAEYTHEDAEVKKDHLVSSQEKAEKNSYSLESLPAQFASNSNYRGIQNEIKSEENIARVTNAFQSPERELYHSPNEIKERINIGSLAVKSTLTNKDAFVTKSVHDIHLSSPTTFQELTNGTFASPKNKSVLKSTTGSTGSLVKKKVIFDLNHDQIKGTLFQNNTGEEEQDAHLSSHSSEKEYLVENEQRRNASNIMLKTTQSDKIAEISRKIEEQLSIARQQPVGSVETMFSTKFMQDIKKDNNESRRASVTSISSLLTSPLQSSKSHYKTANSSLPQPAPRNIKEKASETLHLQTESSDMDSDIDEILRIE